MLRYTVIDKTTFNISHKIYTNGFISHYFAYVYVEFKYIIYLYFLQDLLQRY